MDFPCKDNLYVAQVATERAQVERADFGQVSPEECICSPLFGGTALESLN